MITGTEHFRFNDKQWRIISGAMTDQGFPVGDPDKSTLESIVDTYQYAVQVQDTGRSVSAKTGKAFARIAAAADELREAIAAIETVSGGCDLSFLEAIGARGSTDLFHILPSLISAASILERQANEDILPPRANPNVDFLENALWRFWVGHLRRISGEPAVNSNVVSFFHEISASAGRDLTIDGAKGAAHKAMLRNGFL
ncbi:hypothetical protein JQX09_15600 [Sulfitobacter pseudonitzschiae]|uniref:Uncharacterized protein n=1 Tax=Pseudosulfitobacter pseudonitzschiae TaxID=1402135 RepID=A0A9Q2NS91_9RHOB|nr:hypothetical protein [Pseudosulfitobacter pseudonitzschiae]MBM2293454.1 hypothetical protein [Pseudosulfitobacter pseudonitzschiae]MBM2298268.1 hypothetical protein [Pseudosulfitobacter pseudonitzschiae]MBM2303182.1 hypothetical protein [Pseudosulfitobacter pseudonitzschiae]MBM2312965.1 hypothetical protein [Pseudosulfitobacter pseudonitzschiae]MBM2317878.1 hypothetical protein [Pseudosulfitobacter pseudonitzschiae]